MQGEKQSGDKASAAPEDKVEASADKEGASVEKGAAFVEDRAASAATADALTPGKRWGARVVLMSGVNAR